MMGAIPNAGPHIEFTIENDTWSQDLYHPVLEVRDGKVEIPSGPGWGITINPAWLEKAEYQSSSLD
jgi:L-alanine-DL-glutamate epimerase-like enolase superfamily enzyme